MKCKSEYTNEETYRATKRRQSERYRARTGSGQYWGRWTSEQLHEVMAHKQSDRELSKRIGHSVSAIQTARYRVRRGLVSISGYDPFMDALIPLSEPTEERSDSQHE